MNSREAYAYQSTSIPGPFMPSEHETMAQVCRYLCQQPRIIEITDRHLIGLITFGEQVDNTFTDMIEPTTWSFVKMGDLWKKYSSK